LTPATQDRRGPEDQGFRDRINSEGHPYRKPPLVAIAVNDDRHMQYIDRLSGTVTIQKTPVAFLILTTLIVWVL
jgi:hypothetical protein